MQEVSHTILAKVLHFLYLGDYHNEESACFKELHGPNLPRCTDMTINPPFLYSMADPPDPSEDSIARDYASTDIEVYRCADMWGIDLLKVLATVKIMANMGLMSMRSVISTIASVFEVTTMHDDVLRTAILDTCILNHKIVLQTPRLVELLDQHESRAWRAVLKNIIWSEQDSTSKIAHLKAAHEKELSNIRTSFERSMQQIVNINGKDWVMLCFDEDCGGGLRKLKFESLKWTVEVLVVLRCETCGILWSSTPSELEKQALSQPEDW